MRFVRLGIGMMLFCLTSSLLRESQAQNHPPPRTAVVNGTKYRVFYHWTNDEWGNRLIHHGSYDVSLNQSYMDHAAELEKAGRSTGNFADPGLNISANTHDSAWFAGRSGAEAPDGKVPAKGKLLEVLVPEAQFTKAKFNDHAGQYMGANWYHVDQGMEGSIIQEYKGTGMSQAEMIAAYEKVVADPDVKRRLEKENALRAKAGLKPLEAHPSVDYLHSRLPTLVDEKNVPADHPLRRHYSATRTGMKNAVRIPRGALSAGETVSSVRGGDSCSSGKSSMSRAIDGTIGRAGGAFSVVDAIVPLLVPEANPFAGDPVGIPCEDARADRGRMKCEWDSPLNPLNNVVYCTRISWVRPTGDTTFSVRKFKDVPVCSVGYDSSGFRADDPKVKAFLEKSGYLNEGRTVESVEAFMKDVRSRGKVTDEQVMKGLQVPSKAGKGAGTSEYS